MRTASPSTLPFTISTAEELLGRGKSAVTTDVVRRMAAYATDVMAPACRDLKPCLPVTDPACRDLKSPIGTADFLPLSDELKRKWEADWRQRVDALLLYAAAAPALLAEHEQLTDVMVLLARDCERSRDAPKVSKAAARLLLRCIEALESVNRPETLMQVLLAYQKVALSVRNTRPETRNGKLPSAEVLEKEKVRWLKAAKGRHPRNAANHLAVAFKSSRQAIYKKIKVGTKSP